MWELANFEEATVLSAVQQKKLGDLKTALTTSFTGTVQTVIKDKKEVVKTVPQLLKALQDYAGLSEAEKTKLVERFNSGKYR